MPSRFNALPCALVLAAPAAWAAAPAPPVCAIPTTGLTDALRAMPGHSRVKHSSKRDPDSGEPVLMEGIVFAEGSRFLVQQQNCAIYNLRLSMISPEPDPTEADLDRFAAILAATPVWRAKFAGTDAGAMIRAELASVPYRSGRAAGRPFSYATDALPVTGETSETQVSYIIGQIGAVLTLTIAAGN